jgi:hypothetical protein
MLVKWGAILERAGSILCPRMLRFGERSRGGAYANFFYFQSTPFQIQGQREIEMAKKWFKLNHFLFA